MKGVLRKLSACALTLCLTAGMMMASAVGAGSSATAAAVSSQIEALPSLGPYSDVVNVSDLTSALAAYDALPADGKSSVSETDVKKLEAYRVSLKYAEDNYEESSSGTGYTEREEISYLRYYQQNSDGSYWYIPYGFRSVITLTGSADTITVPLKWVKDFSDYCAMPGDQFFFSAVIVNSSGRNYSYADKSLNVALAADRSLSDGWADDYFYNSLVSFSAEKVNSNLDVLPDSLGSATDKTSSNYTALNANFASKIGTVKSGASSSEATAYISLSGPGTTNKYADKQFGANTFVTFTAEAGTVTVPDDPTPTGDKPVTPSDPVAPVNPVIPVNPANPNVADTTAVYSGAVTIDDEDVPLGASPETGDSRVPSASLAAVCAASVVILIATRRKKA